MARNPYQGDDIDPFSGARDETGATNARPTYASTEGQMDERDLREMEMTKESKGALKKAKAPIVTKEQLKASGFDNLRDYMNAQKGLKRRDGKAPLTTKPKADTRSGGASKLIKEGTFKPPSFRNRFETGAAESAGMKKGGKVATKKYAKGVKIDGCAVRGKTKGRMV